MFEEILGIPAHPLLIHAAVVFVPLQIVAAIAYAFLPWARRNAAWFVLGVAIIAPGAALLAKLSGDAFRARLVRRSGASGAFLNSIDQHRSFGTTTLYWTTGLFVLMIVMLLVHRSAAAKPGGAPGLLVAPGILGLVLSVVTLAVAIVTGYYIFKTGDTGAHIVWGNY